MQNGCLNHSRNGTNSEWAASHFSSLQKVILHAHKRGTQIIVKKKKINSNYLLNIRMMIAQKKFLLEREKYADVGTYVHTYISLPILRFILPDKLTLQL